MAVIGSKPLPWDATWYVKHSLVGSHGAVGVATARGPLEVASYCHLLGGDSSWAICFGNASEGIYAKHQDYCQLISPISPISPNVAGFELKLRCTAAGQLL